MRAIREVHGDSRGLSEARRNALPHTRMGTPELARIGQTRIGFDFAVAEECAVYHECSAYTRAYGPDPGGHQT